MTRTATAHEETGTATIGFAGETLTLHPERAMSWDSEKVLFVADVHLGKAATFRRAGIPVPEVTTARDLATLDGLIGRCKPKHVVILGDLVHARTGLTDSIRATVSDWRQRHESLRITLVTGNHDRSAGVLPEAWAIDCVNPPHVLGPFTLVHDPGEAPASEGSRRAVIAGHVHPVVRLRDRSKRVGTRLPAFIVNETLALLPAFGAFTGGGLIRPGRSDRVYAVTPPPDAAVIAVRSSM